MCAAKAMIANPLLELIRLVPLLSPSGVKASKRQGLLGFKLEGSRAVEPQAGLALWVGS